MLEREAFEKRYELADYSLPEYVRAYKGGWRCLVHDIRQQFLFDYKKKIILSALWL